VPGTDAASSANGVCKYVFVGQYGSACNVQLGGTCSIDVNECASSPCRNGAKCLVSTDKTSTVPVNASHCQCTAGYATGMCAAGSISQYAAQCKVSTGGVCNVDTSECASKPYKNGAKCTDSTVDASVAADAYRCGRGAGSANSVCAYSYIAQYTAACSVYVSNSFTTDSYDVDVNECASSPCADGAVYSESTTAGSSVKVHAYKCSCKPGLSGGNRDADECKSSPTAADRHFQYHVTALALVHGSSSKNACAMSPKRLPVAPCSDVSSFAMLQFCYPLSPASIVQGGYSFSVRPWCEQRTKRQHHCRSPSKRCRVHRILGVYINLDLDRGIAVRVKV
jgi:hypothetical protein